MESVQRVKEINHQPRNTYPAKLLTTQELEENIFSNKQKEHLLQQEGKFNLGERTKM